ncbi:Glycerol-3-phosphate/dihydroxyacetone phosphate acyltransferase [Coemansia sp. Benny D160-2]|nr:Glycerol-3-phosphate/dihydroxyacetone phosphate acyltransferase [Coemansia sp. Benny D160-2]
MEPEESYLIYDLFRAFWTRVVGLFFREIAERNAHLIPKTGPVMFVVAPHHNQFVDPVILLMHAGRRVSYLAAAASMRRLFIGFYGRCLRGIPVERQQDLARRGAGRIRLEDRYAEPTVISGDGTRFTEQVEAGMKIVLAKGAGQARVEAVESDTRLRLSAEMKELAALEALTSSEGAAYTVVPHVDQDEMYRAVYHRLNKGECIGIFPEGGSHDRTEMLPLKAGVAIMALGATAANAELGLKIVPTGLNYFHPSKFRSRAVIDFGQPIDVPPELVAQYQQGGSERREACSELLATVSEGLKQVTLNTPDLETLRLIQAGRRLYQPNLHSLTMAQQVELTRRFIKGYDIYRDMPEVRDLRERIEDYNTELRYCGIRDHQVSSMQMGRAEAGALFAWRLVWLLIMGLVALPGTALNTPVFVVTGVVSKRKARAALAASTVKVRARDVIATWKILIALVLVPSLYSVYSVLAVVFVRRAPLWATAAVSGLDQWSSLRIYVCAWALAAFMSYAALVFGEQAIDIVKSIRPLFLSLVLGKEHGERLVLERQELSDDITDLVNELAPKIYPEFLKTRIKDQLGESRTTHANIINESAHAFHRRMRSGEQALRQRLGGAIVGADDGAADDNGGGGSKTARRSKYRFSPPTPRTMATLNSISPLEFLTSANSTAASADAAKSGGAMAGLRSDAARQSSADDGGVGQRAQSSTGDATPEARNGLFDVT